MRRASRRLPGAGLLLLAAACQSSGAELRGLATLPRLDYAVLVTGGAFLAGDNGDAGTFSGPAGSEPLTVREIAEALRTGAVFQRLGVDPDDLHRRSVLKQLRAETTDPELLQFLQRARDDGFDLLLVVEQLQNGPIDGQGINGRWPVTLATWLLLAVGMFIPDHTFESRATLRVTVRELQTGGVVHDPRFVAGPVDLSLVERGSFLGVLLSIIVPPFWVGSDQASVTEGVRDFTVRRLLLSLARDLKSEPTRQKLRENLGAAIALGGTRRLRIDAAESVVAVRLRPTAGPLSPALAQRFEQQLLASLRADGGRFVYEAELPAELAPGAVQVLVGTITGGVASATVIVEAAP